MFGTLHCNSPTKEAEFVERPYGSLNPGMNSACDRCRANKVKCTVSGKSCSRCRRLKKTCSFTSVRQRSSQRVWKTEVNSRRQKSQSSDRSAHPQTSPSPRDSGNEGDDHTKQGGSISSGQTDENDDSDKGDPQPTDYTLHQLSKASASASGLPFLADYDQPDINEQKDDMCTCSILPFPFCASSVHYNSPDAIARSNIGTPQILPTPLALRDEIPQQLLPNSQLNDPRFGRGPINTESASISSLASSIYWSQDSNKKPCPCLTDLIFALEKLEESCSSGSRAVLDSIIANQKDAIELCRNMLKCSDCMGRRANFVLLVFMSERIIVVCSRIVAIYRMQDDSLGNRNNGTSTATPSELACLPGPRIFTGTNIEMDSQCLTAASTSASASPSRPTTLGWQLLLLGDYKINSALEWDHLMRTLINLQLQAVKVLLREFTSMGTMILGDVQKKFLVRAEAIVHELEQDIYVI